MEFLAFVEIIKIISAIGGAIITITTLVGLLSKKPRKWLSTFCGNVCKEANEELIEKIDKLQEEMDKNNTTSLNLLRNNITHIYEKYKGEECFSERVKENLCNMYKEYESRGGNSYVHEIYEEMMTWHTR